jgi:hypothetical protein
MAQTTTYFGLISGSPKLEYNTTGGSSFTDATGEMVSVDMPDNLRDVAAVHTLDGDLPLIQPGKIKEGAMKVVAVYTGASSGFFQDALVAYQNGTPLYFRFYPAGSAAGRYRFSSGNNAVGSAGSTTNGACYVQKRAVPNVVDADKAAVFTYEVDVMTPGFTGASL